MLEGSWSNRCVETTCCVLGSSSDTPGRSAPRPSWLTISVVVPRLLLTVARPQADWTHEAVVGCHRCTRLRRCIPDEQARRGGHVDVRADRMDVFHNVNGQSVSYGDGIHPAVGGVVPSPNASVGRDVEHIARFCKSVHDVGRQASDESSVPELVGVWIKHLHARRASSSPARPMTS